MKKPNCYFNLTYNKLTDCFAILRWLYIAVDEDEAKEEKWINAGNPRHTTRNPR